MSRLNWPVDDKRQPYILQLGTTVWAIPLPTGVDEQQFGSEVKAFNGRDTGLYASFDGEYRLLVLICALSDRTTRLDLLHAALRHFVRILKQQGQALTCDARIFAPPT